MYRDDGKYQLSLDTKQGLDPGMRSWPWNVCVNADGEWLVTDERRFVKVYSPKGVYTNRWAAVSPKNKPSNTENTRLCALALDCNNQVLVGQVCDPVMYISRHRRDTSHIDSFKVDIQPYHVAATLQNTIIISDHGSIVQIVNNTGNLLHTLNAGGQLPFWYPFGVCVHNDKVFVCNTDWKNCHEITCFSLSADYRGSIAVSERPWCVAIAKEGSQILVSFPNMVQVFSRKR